MPNTPLARRLHGIVARAEAEQRGPTRREFLIGGAAAAGAVALGRFPPPARGATAPKVVVVGAGLAGLTCTHRLKQAGIIADLHEATSRLGGRVWTRRGDFAANQLAEHGGELIDTGHRELRRLAKQMDLELEDLLGAEVPGTVPFYLFDGSSYSDAQAGSDYLEVRPQLRADVQAAGYPTTYLSSTPRGRELDRMSVAEYIDEIVPGGRASNFGQLLDVAYTIEYGAGSSDQSALNLLYLLGYSTRDFDIFGESDEKFRIQGGNDQLVDRLAAPVPGQIVRGSELVRIRHRANGGYDLDFRQGATTRSVRADRAVFALPFSIIRASVDYGQADFRPLKRRAIREQGIGQNTKLHVQFATRYWRPQGCNGDTYADTGYQNTWEVSRAQAGTPGILVDYTGGDAAVALRGDPDALARKFCRQIEPVLPGAVAAYNGKATLDHWPSNPWTRGSYSYWRVHQYQDFAGVEAEPEGEAHFCGEHTSINFQGYMNGAVETGERAASEVIQALR